MVNCSYCGDVLGKRLVFCKPSHKVMYHAKKSSSPKKDTIQAEVAVNPTKVVSMKLCPHYLEESNCERCNG